MASAEKCDRCGQPAAGYARINGRRYCHGNTQDVSCYMQQQHDDAKPRPGGGGLSGVR